MDRWIARLVYLQIDESVDRLIGGSVDGGSLDWWINRSLDPWIGRSMDR